MARVNQLCLTADIWLRAECGNTIPDRSKGQPTAIRERVAQQGGETRWHNKVARIKLHK